VPEIEIHYKAEPEWDELITVRGILGRGNEKLIILLDGFRIDAKSKIAHSIGHNFTLAGIQRVEVVIGPVSALYGPDAFVGVVQLISKSGAEVRGGRVTASIGRFNTTENSFTAGTQAGDGSR
jgi:outer membrane cobalamin receptor